MAATLQCPHCTRKLAVRTERMVSKGEFAFALLNGETTFDVAEQQMVSPSGRVFALDGSLYVAGVTCALTTTAGVLASAMLNWHWSLIALSALSGAVAGWVFSLAFQAGAFDVKLPARDEEPVDVDKFVTIKPAHQWAKADVPSGIPGNFGPSAYIEFAKAALRRGISEGKLAKCDNNVCSQPQYKKLLAWMANRNMVRQKGKSSTSGYELTGRGRQILEHISRLHHSDFAPIEHL